MKVIDLFNKIANGEIPKKIKYGYDIYEYNEEEQDYIYFETGEDKYKHLIEDNIICAYNLLEEVEFIEDTPKEDKKITKLDNNIAFYEGIYQTCWNDREVLLASKINEIIDKVNGDK